MHADKYFWRRLGQAWAWIFGIIALASLMIYIQVVWGIPAILVVIIGGIVWLTISWAAEESTYDRNRSTDN